MEGEEGVEGAVRRNVRVPFTPSTLSPAGRGGGGRRAEAPGCLGLLTQLLRRDAEARVARGLGEAVVERARGLVGPRAEVRRLHEADVLRRLLLRLRRPRVPRRPLD